MFSKSLVEMESITTTNPKTATFQSSIKRVRFADLIDDRFYYVNVLKYTREPYGVTSVWITAQISIYHTDSVMVTKKMQMYGQHDSPVQLIGSVPGSFPATKEEVDGDENTPSEFYDTCLKLEAEHKEKTKKKKGKEKVWTCDSQNRYRFYVLKDTASSVEDAASVVGGGSSGPGTVRSLRASTLAARPVPGAPAMGGAGGPSPVGGGSSATAATAAAASNEDPSSRRAATAATASAPSDDETGDPTAPDNDAIDDSVAAASTSGGAGPATRFRKTRRFRRRRNNRRSSRRSSNRKSR
jgi:hypothetical protein